MKNISFLDELEARLKKLESELNIYNRSVNTDTDLNSLAGKMDSVTDGYFEPKMELFEPSKKRFIDY